MRPLLAPERFEIVQEIGQGAMGTVYEALDLEHNTKIAVKTLRSLDANGIHRFKREFRSLQGLEHPNLIGLGELIENNGNWCFTMELISGRDILSHIRPPAPIVDDNFGDCSTVNSKADGKMSPQFDEAALRNSLVQLAKGLNALHAAGFVHRDIKPSNILVTEAGRVVILDLGLVTESARKTSENVVGTAIYMAPEQAASKAVGPAADWYSVGCIVYEALTGRSPIEGTTLEILMKKQRATPVPPRDLCRDIPEDLHALCTKLLAIEPEKRPTGEQILRLLGQKQTAVAALGTSRSRTHAFVGRERELEVLKKSYREASQQKNAEFIFIHGESGIGKSALVEHFIRELRHTAESTVVFQSRCYERESVPYKAFDGIIDAFTKHLIDAEPVEAASLIPTDISPLTDIFPVLRRSDVVARVTRKSTSTFEPSEKRSRGFAAIRDMFYRLTNQHPVIIAIDDFQWADTDSLLLLNALFETPDAPPIMLIATVREEPSREKNHRKLFKKEGFAKRATRVTLRGLTEEDANLLADSLFQTIAPQHREHASSIVKESKGHPLFINEMVRYDAEVGFADESMQLQSALWSRVLSLSQEAKGILECVSISDIPVRKDTVAAALNLDYSRFSRCASELRVANLVQTSGARSDDEITVFHDQIRRAVVNNLALEQTSRLHEKIAVAMETSSVDSPEALANHWTRAGEPNRAYLYLKKSAYQAVQVLAFERAAVLFRRCLEHDIPSQVERTQLQVELGEALVNSGRGVEAANVYMNAAKDSPGESISLNGKAAAALLKAGHIDSALAVIEQPLAELRMPMPANSKSAFRSLLWHRFMIRLRGLRFRFKKSEDITSREITRLDIAWAFASALAFVDTIRGAEFQARLLRMSIRAGDPLRIALALTGEFGYRATGGIKNLKDSQKVMRRAESLCVELGNPPQIVALQKLVRGVAAVCQGKWLKCESILRETETYIIGNCTGLSWELASARLFGFWAQWYQGKLREIARRIPKVTSDARSKGDLYFVAGITTYFKPMTLLVSDRPAEARATLNRALSKWSQRQFNFQHYSAFLAEVQVLLYENRGEDALHLCEKTWPQLKSSLLLYIEQNRIEAIHLEARSLLLAATATDVKRLKRVRRHIRSLARAKDPWAHGLAMLLQAGLSFKTGDITRAEVQLSTAEITLAENDLHLYRIAAKYQRLVAFGGKDVDQESAGAEFRDLGVRSPEKFSRMLVPGFSEPSPSA